MKPDRRDLLKFAGGSAAGFLLTPLPWRLLDDVAIRSENWPGVPVPLRGEIKTKFTTCALCPAACGMRARCVGDRPVSLAGVAGHPISNGALCPMGLAAHLLPYSSGRARRTLKRTGDGWVGSSAEEAARAVAVAMKSSSHGELVAVFDERPGRIRSLLYRDFARRLGNAIYVVPPSTEDATLRAVAAALEQEDVAFGIDLENTRTLLSFGAPVLDGWGTPGRVFHARDKFKLIQAEPRQSRTAMLADTWLPLRPGTEAALALGLANVIVSEKLFDLGVAGKARDFQAVASLAAEFPPERVAQITGIPASEIVRAAREFANGAPAVAIGGGDPGAGGLGRAEEAAIAALNILIGGVGKIGGIVSRRALPVPASLDSAAQVRETEFDNIPNGSIRVLILGDGASGRAFPWPLIANKLASRALVVSLSNYLGGYAEHAHFIVPAASFPESIEEVPQPFDAAAASFALSAPLTPASAGATEPSGLLGRIAPGGPTELDALKERAASVLALKRGGVFRYADAQRLPVEEFKTADDFWNALLDGACWFDEPAAQKTLARFSLLGGDPKALGNLRETAAAGRLGGSVADCSRYPLALVPFGWRGAAGSNALPPIFTKLYQESGIRDGGACVALHPDTARNLDLKEGDIVEVITSCGARRKRVRVDSAVMPGVMEAAVGPAHGEIGLASPEQNSILDICGVKDAYIWRVTRASVRKV